MDRTATVRKLLLSVPSAWFLYSAVRRPQVGALALYAKASGLRRSRSPGGTILFYPERPNLRHMIWKALALKHVKFHCEPERPYDLAVLWEDSTFTQPDRAAALARLHTRAINGDLLDIGKERVTAVFERTFGYSLAVDPRTHRGPCVRKSNDNAAHDGQIVKCPSNEKTSGYVYQILVDNRRDDRTIVDYRLPVIANEMPFVYKKQRPLDIRFANTNTKVELAATPAVFSSQELSLIKRFCRALGCELGELDVLRDRGSDRIYVVDVNRTPFGPPSGLPIPDAIRAMQEWAGAFERQFLGTERRYSRN